MSSLRGKKTTRETVHVNRKTNRVNTHPKTKLSNSKTTITRKTKKRNYDHMVNNDQSYNMDTKDVINIRIADAHHDDSTTIDNHDPIKQHEHNLDDPVVDIALLHHTPFQSSTYSYTHTSIDHDKRQSMMPPSPSIDASNNFPSIVSTTPTLSTPCTNKSSIFRVDNCDPFFQTLDIKPDFNISIHQDMIHHSSLPNHVPLPCRLHGGAPLNDNLFFVLPRSWDPFLEEYRDCLGYFRSPGCAARYAMIHEPYCQHERIALMKQWAFDRYGINCSRLGPAPAPDMMKPYGLLEWNECCINLPITQLITTYPVKYTMAPVVEEIYRIHRNDSSSQDSKSVNVNDSSHEIPITTPFHSNDVRFKSQFCQPDDESSDMDHTVSLTWTRCPAPWKRASISPTTPHQPKQVVMMDHVVAGRPHDAPPIIPPLIPFSSK